MRAMTIGDLQRPTAPPVATIRQSEKTGPLLPACGPGCGGSADCLLLPA